MNVITKEGKIGLAQFSPDMKYRYLLQRFLPGKGPKGIVAAIGLNPSTADQDVNDPTITRLIKYATKWQYKEFRMLNVFAYRSTDPKELYHQEDPVGPDNNAVIRGAVKSADLILCAWGTHAVHQDRHNRMMSILSGKKLHCLKVTKENYPQHPLYLKADLLPIPYGPVEIESEAMDF